MAHHGITHPRGITLMCRRESLGGEPHAGRFGRIFPKLPPLYCNPGGLVSLGRRGGPMDGGRRTQKSKRVPLGLIFLGQLIDHDITLDVSSSLTRTNDPFAIENVRTPALDLDCVYGSGPEAAPWLYHSEGDFSGVKLLTGADGVCVPAGHTRPSLATLQKRANDDLARNATGTALIGDFRNDENRIVSQLQLGLIRFHNKVVDRIRTDEPVLKGHDLFEKARDHVRWHYQWIVVYEFLTGIAGREIVDDILACGRRFYDPCHSIFIPIEFAAAAYRFGHSMVTQRVRTRVSDRRSFDLFGRELGGGFTPVRTPEAVVDWRLFFGSRAQKAAALDVKLPQVLLELPFVQPPAERSLATRNLLRGQSFWLPSGEKIAEEMKIDTAAQRRLHRHLATIRRRHGLGDGTPLWYYILAEAERVGRGGDANAKGEGLGPVGGRIVAEVLIGLLEEDKTSFLGGERNWVPYLGRRRGSFSMLELLR